MGIEIENTKEELFKKGKFAYKRKQYEKALSFFNESLICDENFSKALLGKAKSLYKLGRLSESSIIYDELFNSNCLDYYIWLRIGNFYFYVLNNNLKALKSYNNGIKFDKDLSVLWLNKGKVLTSMNMYEEALNSFITSYKLRSSSKLLNFLERNLPMLSNTSTFSSMSQLVLITLIALFNKSYLFLKVESILVSASLILIIYF